MLSTFEEFLDEVYPEGEVDAQAGRDAETEERQRRLAEFPYSVVLQVRYPEMDFANRWCWEQFGSASGPCYQSYSSYPVCRETGDHGHEGNWRTEWLAKIAYNFGFNEWLFAHQTDRDRFLAFVPDITCGELFPK
ncbi:hypothetical protein [Mitsuaria sp. 7]|uniref:hypothetical protein n=1 Tax=Mitsuaria sp. 7 TaxID=1658665 RepID=UPI0007DDF3E7|nr:hypothetical protein [Mitsuaria sp. 7]ANH71034.1 hypothetical protein ABE85_26360 [Mitsuaria sp. 7]